MSDETTNKSNAQGTETNTSVTDNKETSDVDNVKKDYEALKAINDKMDSELLRAEQLKAKVRQGGKAEAGQETKQISPEDKKQAQAKEFFKGTALGDAIKKTNE